MAGPFDFLNSINYDKNDMTLDEPEFIKEYNPFIINRSLSYHIDSIMLSNEMNKYSFIDKEMQYKFFLYSLPKKKRFAKWAKSEVDENIEFLSKYYGVNMRVAEKYYKLYTKEKLNELINKNKQHGIKK